MNSNEVIDEYEVITEIINEWITQGRAFTAYEVSKEAQKRGVKSRHNNLRDAIHEHESLADAIGSGDWLRTMVPVGAGRHAFLYHLQSYDPTNYQPLGSLGTGHGVTSGVSIATPLPTVSIPLQGVLVGSTAGAFVKLVDNSYHLDDRNRLLIPTRFIRDAGCEPGDKVHVIIGDKYVFVTKNAPATPNANETVQQQIVEGNGDLRLSLGTLLTSGLTTTSFQIENADYQSETAVKIFN